MFKNQSRVSNWKMTHADVLKKNYDVLQRCTTINFYVIDYLRAKDVLNEKQEHDLKTERNPLSQQILLYQWLKKVSHDKYESFLQVMKDTEQEHVANLLTGGTEEDQLPLSDARYNRLVKIRYKMAQVTRIDSELIAELRSQQAISMTDSEEIRAEKVEYTRVSKLISVIMRRSNHSYNCFQDALRKTLQEPAANFLREDRRLLTAEKDADVNEGKSTAPKMGKIYQNPSRPRSPNIMEAGIKKHREFLVDRIDPDFGLLDKLLASKTLTREALHKITLKDNTPEKKNRKLLDIILKNKKVDELFSALADSGQNHLVSYLNADGEYTHAPGDDWPLSESDISRLNINHESLVDLLDTSDLCIRLFSEGVINNRQKQLISSKPTDAEKNEALLDILTKCSLRQYKKTIDCLNDSNQSHIANLLSKGGVLVRVHANLEGAVGNVDEQEEGIISQLTRFLERDRRPFEEASRLLELTQQRIIAARKGQ